MQRSLTGQSLTRFNRWRRQRRVQNVATIGLVILGPALAVLTYIVLGPLDQNASAPALRLVLLADLVYVLALAAMVVMRMMQVIASRRRRSAGSRLHLRLTGAFALLALIPTVTVAVFSVLTINIGLEGWFSDRVRNVVGSSLQAAQAYEEEHRQEVGRDARALAEVLDRERRANFFMNDGEVRQLLGRLQPQIERGLSEVYVVDGTGEIRVRGPSSYEFDFEQPPPEAFVTAAAEGIAVLEDWDNNEFRALLPLSAFVDRYLYVTREVDGEILALLDETQATVNLYEQLEADRGRLLFEFGLLYLGFAALLILAATWLGLWFAERLSKPVGRLVSASQRVGAGDLDVRVIEDEGDDEISQLGRDFNKMTEQLNAQRQTLLENTRQIERRRRLFDSVLSSITSGVVGLDPEGRVTFANRSARRLLIMGEAQEDMALPVAIPEFGHLFHQLRDEGREVAQEQINLVRMGKQESLLVRMSPRRSEDGELEGYVVAFDDVTDLVSAQRMAAWGDVARRIAHEIKNPLTPIQLSAERIKRKFRAAVGDDADKLDNMTDVIVRQTNDLRRIVDEFSKFARMPEPERRKSDLSALLRDAVTLQEAGQPEVAFAAEIPETPVWADVDQGMISQALTNLIKNAGEAIESRREAGTDDAPGEIRVNMALEPGAAVLTIADNGVGLPEDRARLFEPYVTTRDKGTGLGLPIVKKIIEEHGGTLTLEDAEPFAEGARRGARAVIRLPLALSVSGAGQPPEKETA
ncbi:PAS domain-containing sensor histidine kinase [Wenxinia marina]|uniref:histidine kinase n=1 Tax=Wenxinia marina DSM 24838 TaxID=1123501 RepID=A0A0D0Q9D0_9RHOB|nr:PAS domain-containing sensor histidine kinase [Wenxinia marina]KIQ67653.1 Signal transduction histidine kinase involved in nitrogen fixation and metabolism regulation [Wenxinia marina DSM 24838]GGL79977.1 PAS domain-containing sensor histidine kinase [Wenxinia marina]